MDGLDTAAVPLEDAAAQAKRHLLLGLSLEATPAGLDRLDRRLPVGTEVYLPALQASSDEERAKAASRLLACGLQPVPHLAARRIADRPALEVTLAHFREAGVRRLLLIAGDPARPAGAFTSTLDMLGTGLLERYGFGHFDVAGHPEGHPAVPEAALDAALLAKQAHARATGTDVRIVTQFVFDADPLVAFDARLRRLDIALPVRVGVAGPARLRTLLAYAWQCGIGASARALARRPDAARLLGAWTPDVLVDRLARHVATDPATRIEGLHLFPFGGIERALAWRDQARAGGFDGRA